MRHPSLQLPLVAPYIAHPHAVELQAMSAVLDEQPALSARVQQDLDAGCPANAHTGRPGLTGEQTLRFLIVRQLTGWTYAELAFHLADSLTYRAFCRVSALVPAPSKSALAATLRRVSAGTLAALNDALVTSPAARAVERGRTVRMDATVVPVAIQGGTASMRKGSWIVRPTHVSVRIGEPVDTCGMTMSDREQLANMVRARVEELLAQGPVS